MLKAKTRIFIACLLITQFEVANAQESRQTSSTPKPVVFDTQQDRQHMLDQLGITKLRPGKSGNADDPNAANTDESKANPYPNPRTTPPASNAQPLPAVRKSQTKCESSVQRQ